MVGKKIVEKLNKEVRCTLAPSPIHGIGVFAIRDIKKGEKLYCIGKDQKTDYFLSPEDFAKLRPEVRKLIKQRWSLGRGEFQSPNDDARLTSFLNHSDDPNYDWRTDMAIRDIAEGEEVTECYFDEIKDEMLAIE